MLAAMPIRRTLPVAVAAALVAGAVLAGATPAGAAPGGGPGGGPGHGHDHGRGRFDLQAHRGGLALVVENTLRRSRTHSSWA
jgi:glycerophosphoryl diester phosphodiesterase